jgi:hypothetical protein
LELDLGRSELDLRQVELDLRHSKSNSASYDLLFGRSKEGHLRQKMFLVMNAIEEMTGLIPSNCVKRMLDGKKEENSLKKCEEF